MSVGDNELRKYKINECLLKLSIIDYRKAVRRIPLELGISLNTFHNYRNILLNDVQDIPYEKVVMFEKLFGLPCGGLLNKIIKTGSLEDLLKGELPERKRIRKFRRSPVEVGS